jgi:hypothetical protein
MDELIGELATRAGMGSAIAEKPVGIILGFLRTEGPSDKVQALIDKIPGAEAAIASANQGGGLAKLMGGGLMAVGTRLMGLGLGGVRLTTSPLKLLRFKPRQNRSGPNKRDHCGDARAEPTRLEHLS